MKWLPQQSLAAAAILLIVVLSGATTTQAASVDYVGFAWESGGIATSNPGDALSIATVVTQIDPLFGVDLIAREATLYIDGLTSTGTSIDPATGATIIVYTGGTLSLYAHPSPDHDWGFNPANATVPSTFVNGELVFQGQFTSFALFRQSSGLGVFEGYLDGTGGSALAGPCSGCAYTFAGTFATATGAQIPQGYDLQVDGVLDVNSAVGTESLNWGTLKQMFRANH